ncbi:MAG: hypothetical protein O3A95_08350 [Planctomycetota bacterium]|nr:hypothetical protein [Planctomycetota bacterium]MDA1114292.1 hypothetical protein [Planctomycetota bacterium]
MKRESRWPLSALLLLTFGIIQMVGDLLPSPPLKGFETYSTQTFLDWTDRNGVSQSIEFTPDSYSKILGPYNRRNIYGAALAYGPVFVEDDLLKPIFQSVVGFALTGEAPLLQELGVDVESVSWPLTLRYVPAEGTNMGDLPLSLEIPLP